MKPGRFIALLAALLVAVPLPAQEEAKTPFARARLEPAAEVTVGQPVSIVVEVLVPTWFTGAPRFPNLDVRDALTIFEDRGSNFTERIDGQTWAGQSRRFTVYPQRAGRYEVSEIPVAVSYNAGGTQRASATVSPDPVAFEARLPPGAEGHGDFIVTSRLDLDQALDPEPETLKIGEAFRRTLTVTVQDALAMVIPPLMPADVPGLAAYPDPPVVRDSGGERGERIVGSRVESATYVAEEAGQYRLPAVELKWWDVGAGRFRKAALPELEFEVVPEMALVSEIGLPPEEVGSEPAAEAVRRRISWLDLLRRWGAPLAALAVLLWLSRRYGPALKERLQAARHRRAESEEVGFRRFQGAARSGDPRTTWQELTIWLDRAHKGPGAATVRGFVVRAADPDLAREVEALAAVLFTAGGEAGAAGWSGKRLSRAVARARRRARFPGAQSSGATGSVLNPSG